MVRFSVLIVALAALVGCNRGIDNKEAVRQSLVDYLASRTNINMSSMNVDVSSVVFRDNQADAVVSFTPKGAAPGGGMTMRYAFEKKGGKWVVKNRADSGKNPHGGAVGEGMPNPGGMAPAPTEMPPGHPQVPDQEKK